MFGRGLFLYSRRAYMDQIFSTEDLDLLIENKKLSVRSLDNELRTARRELEALVAFKSIQANPDASLDWEGFLEFLKREAPNLHTIITTGSFSLLVFRAGELRVKAKEAHEGELLRFHDKELRRLLKEFSGDVSDWSFFVVEDG